MSDTTVRNDIILENEAHKYNVLKTNSKFLNEIRNLLYPGPAK